MASIVSSHHLNSLVGMTFDYHHLADLDYLTGTLYRNGNVNQDAIASVTAISVGYRKPDPSGWEPIYSNATYTVVRVNDPKNEVVIHSSLRPSALDDATYGVIGFNDYSVLLSLQPDFAPYLLVQGMGLSIDYSYLAGLLLDGNMRFLAISNPDLAMFPGARVAYRPEGTANIDLAASNSNDDTVLSTNLNEVFHLGEGTDTVLFSAPRSQYRIGIAGEWVRVSGPDGLDDLKDVERLGFGGSAPITTQSLRSQPGTEELMSFITGGRLSFELPIPYTGPLNLEYIYPGTNEDDVVAGTNFNDFMNLAGGNDAVHMGAGDDVVDGGGGSNFLSGDSGRDTFFLDGRFLVPVWSCITDWEVGEALSLWGWQAGVSKATWSESDGLPGYKGATMYADIDGNGKVETAITWAGKATSQLPSQAVLQVSGIGVLYFG